MPRFTPELAAVHLGSAHALTVNLDVAQEFGKNGYSKMILTYCHPSCECGQNDLSPFLFAKATAILRFIHSLKIISRHFPEMFYYVLIHPNYINNPNRKPHELIVTLNPRISPLYLHQATTASMLRNCDTVMCFIKSAILA